mmetsp:Transcript_110828/g.213525  ORF Transcript_110828/g.213525 Transcript_110828/m.213525 type:complete len:470 (-) Transcript_110828:49-1458(-)
MSDEAAQEEEAPARALDPLTSLLQASRKNDAKAAAEAPAKAQATRMPPPAPGDGTEVRCNAELFDVAATLGRNQRKVTGAQSVDDAGAEQISDSALTTRQRIENALAASSNVDFPTVTEICERVAAQPQEAKEAVLLLLRVFSDRNCHFRRRLKALTIMHELVYDQRAAEELRAAPSALGSLRDLQQTHNTGLGDDADGHIRMFATELERRCYGLAAQAPNDQDVPGRKRDKAMELFWELGSSLKDNLAAAASVVAGEESATASSSFAASPDAADRKKALAMGLLRDVGTSFQSAVTAMDSALDNAIDYAHNYAAQNYARNPPHGRPPGSGYPGSNNPARRAQLAPGSKAAAAPPSGPGKSAAAAAAAPQSPTPGAPAPAVAKTSEAAPAPAAAKASEGTAAPAVAKTGVATPVPAVAKTSEGTPGPAVVKTNEDPPAPPPAPAPADDKTNEGTPAPAAAKRSEVEYEG